jgi:hypothetical protein
LGFIKAFAFLKNNLVAGLIFKGGVAKNPVDRRRRIGAGFEYLFIGSDFLNRIIPF